MAFTLLCNGGGDLQHIDVAYVQILCCSSWGLGLKLWEPFPWACLISQSQNSCLKGISHAPSLCSVSLAVALPAFLGSLLPSLKYWCSERLMNSLLYNYFYFMPVSILAACLYGHHIPTKVSDTLGLESQT